MTKKTPPQFNPNALLAKVVGRSIYRYDKNQTIFQQGEAADAVFYIQSGKVKLTVGLPPVNGSTCNVG